MRTYSLGLISILLVPLFLSCSTTEPVQRTVERVERDKVIDLSGRWNDTDSKLVADELIRDAMTSNWLTSQVNDKKPVITVGNIKNSTYDHINVNVFVSDLQKAIIESGKATFILPRNDKDDIRDERRDQQAFARDETVKLMAAETGADIMLQGEISAIIDQLEGKRVVFYQVDLQAVNIETGEMLWIGQKKIKKMVEQPKWTM